MTVFEVSALRVVLYTDKKISYRNECSLSVRTLGYYGDGQKDISRCSPNKDRRLRKRVHSAATQWSMHVSLHRCKIGCSPILSYARFMDQLRFGSALRLKMTTVDGIFGGGL